MIFFISLELYSLAAGLSSALIPFRAFKTLRLSLASGYFSATLSIVVVSSALSFLGLPITSLALPLSPLSWLSSASLCSTVSGCLFCTESCSLLVPFLLSFFSPPNFKLRSSKVFRNSSASSAASNQ